MFKKQVLLGEICAIVIARSHIYWNSIYKAYEKINKYKIFEVSYKDLLNKYYMKSSNNKLKFVSSDTTFIPNKKGRDCIAYNKFYNRKNGIYAIIIAHINNNRC